jgi:voltage-gated potassium channel
MRVAEGNIIRENINLNLPLTGFEQYANCFWCVFITMATVGYGDYFPVTTAGRLVGVLAAVSGIIVSSLLIVSLTAYLTMQPS